MNPGFELYRPVRSMFIDMGNATEPDFQEYVSWKTKDQPSYNARYFDRTSRNR